MDIGIGLPATIAGVTREQLLEWARRAEARGFSSLGTIDRLVYGNYEPLIALAAAAAVTERIRLATTILIAPTAPMARLLAKQAATLDHLSNGRLVLGVAVGGREDDYEASGVDFHTRGRPSTRCSRSGSGSGPARASAPPGRSGRSRRTAGRRWSSAVRPTPPSSERRAMATAGSWAAAPPTSSRMAWPSRRRLGGGGPRGPPRTMALAYFALGDGAQAAADRYLQDYYAFLGEYAGMIAGSAATDAETVRQYVAGFAAAGCDELVIFPTSPDPDQVDLLADAVGDALDPS